MLVVDVVFRVVDEGERLVVVVVEGNKVVVVELPVFSFPSPESEFPPLVPQPQKTNRIKRRVPKRKSLLVDTLSTRIFFDEISNLYPCFLSRLILYLN